MIVDSSAVIAVLQGEPTADACTEALIDNDCRMSAANWLEAAIVADNRSIRTQRDFNQLMEIAKIAIEPVTTAQIRVAREAYRRFGRGSGHAAHLNFGDAFAYALAVTTGEPLLFVGDDFAATDILSALPSW